VTHPKQKSGCATGIKLSSSTLTTSEVAADWQEIMTHSALRVYYA